MVQSLILWKRARKLVLHHLQPWSFHQKSKARFIFVYDLANDAYSCIIEGIDADDRYRMVEDEFLSVAKKYTVHLHTAEYKRKEKLAKSRNSDTIRTISRPVVGQMSDQTRRKFEAKARSKAQKDAINSIKKKEADDSDDSIENDLPYVGTFLHGLMDSPQKKTTDLSSLRSIKIVSRAAAGFSAQSGVKSSVDSYSPLKFKQEPKDGHSTASEDEDDPDAPIPLPKFAPVAKGSVPKTSSIPTSRLASSFAAQLTKPPQNPAEARSSAPSNSSDIITPQQDSMGLDSIRTSAANQRRPMRKEKERVRQEKAQQEKKEQAKKLRDVIPTFL